MKTIKKMKKNLFLKDKKMKIDALEKIVEYTEKKEFIKREELKNLEQGLTFKYAELFEKGNV